MTAVVHYSWSAEVGRNKDFGTVTGREQLSMASGKVRENPPRKDGWGGYGRGRGVTECTDFSAVSSKA